MVGKWRSIVLQEWEVFRKIRLFFHKNVCRFRKIRTKFRKIEIFRLKFT